MNKEYKGRTPIMSVNEATKKYNALMHDVATNDYYKIDVTNRVNCYVCRCGHITKTRDVDPGCTPFYFNCESCGMSAQSTFYKDILPDQKPTIEWYRPTLDEVLKLRDEPNLLSHIFLGGLNHRQIQKDHNEENKKPVDNRSRRERRAAEREAKKMRKNHHKNR